MMKYAFVSALVAVAAFAAIAQDKPAAKPAAPAAKPVAKKVAPPLPDAGDWKPLDNKKGHLAGPQISEGDLFCQPVIVIVFDPLWRPEPRVREDEPHKFVRIQGETSKARFLYLSTPSRELSADDAATFAKDYPKTSGAGPCYANFGLVTPPVNKDMKFPFFYAVSIDKKIIYAGDRFDAALAKVMQDVRKHPDCHELLGYYKPQVLSDKVAGLKFGEPMAKTVQTLKGIVKTGKDPEAKKEAQDILNVLDQSKTYWMNQCLATARSKPPLGAMMCYAAMKTFASPKDKESLKRAIAMVEGAFGKQNVKLYQKLCAYKEKMPEKKSDIKKALVDAQAGEKACAKAKKQFGDKMPQSFIALEDLVMEVKANLEAALETAGAK